MGPYFFSTPLDPSVSRRLPGRLLSIFHLCPSGSPPYYASANGGRKLQRGRSPRCKRRNRVDCMPTARPTHGAASCRGNFRPRDMWPHVSQYLQGSASRMACEPCTEQALVACTKSGRSEEEDSSLSLLLCTGLFSLCFCRSCSASLSVQSFSPSSNMTAVSHPMYRAACSIAESMALHLAATALTSGCIAAQVWPICLPGNCHANLAN